jgi:hypothetical protein
MLNINVDGYFLLPLEENEDSESGMSSETLQHQQNKNKFWKYSNSCLKMGFIQTLSEDYQRPLYTICYGVLSNEGLNPTRLCQYLETQHSDYANNCCIIQLQVVVI